VNDIPHDPYLLTHCQTSGETSVEHVRDSDALDSGPSVVNDDRGGWSHVIRWMDECSGDLRDRDPQVRLIEE